MKKLHCILLIALALFSNSASAAGVTIITHGLSGDIGGWIIPMAEQILGDDALCYEIAIRDDGFGNPYLTQWKLNGPALVDSVYGEIIIKLDWADFATIGSFLTSSSDIAAWVTPALLSKTAIPELSGRSLVELPIHLIGHSRGGSVVSEITRLLGAQGVWVDHVTFLDPHPVALYGDADIYA